MPGLQLRPAAQRSVPAHQPRADEPDSPAAARAPRRSAPTATPAGAAATVAANGAAMDDNEDFLEEDDEMADFIEYEGPGGAEAHRAAQRRLRAHARAQGISAEAMQDINEVFGGQAEANQLLALWEAQAEGAAVDGDAQVRLLTAHIVHVKKASKHSVLWAHWQAETILYQVRQSCRFAVSPRRAAWSPLTTNQNHPYLHAEQSNKLQSLCAVRR